MIFSTVFAVLVTVAPSESQILHAVTDDFERAGRANPVADPGLTRAAKLVAERALVSGVEDAASLLRVTAAVSKNGGWDPSPTAVVVRGGVDDLLKTLDKNAFADEPASLVGVALAQGGGRASIAVLLARRKMELQPFPRALPRPSPTPVRLCGALREPLQTAEVFVTRPDGAVDRLDMGPEKGQVCTAVAFSTAGRHTVEVLARGPRGPEVAALFFVDAGPVRAADEEAVSAEPTSDADARAQLLVRINALRLRMGLGAVKPDAALDAIAQAWAKRLADENFFSHVAPDGSDLKKRLTEAGYHYTSAGENLGLSSGPLSAHFGIEHSPGHRRNLLEKDHQKLGVGVARRSDGMAVLVEVLALPGQSAEALSNPVEAAYSAIAAERARKKLPRLAVNATLEALAQQHARAAFEAQTPSAKLAGKKKLHDQIFDTLEEVKTCSVDLFVSENPKLIVDSNNLASDKTNLVGVGLVRGDSAQYGNGRYWIVVIYAGTN